MGGRGASSSNSSNNYKWLQTNHNETIAKNLNEKEAKDRLAKLLRSRYERISRR